MPQATYDDVNPILRLYDMRREEKLREARAWFSASFKFKSLAELDKGCPPGRESDAFARQVTSYWEMVCSFIVAGVLDQELFFQSGRELLFVWTRVELLLPEIRAAYQDPSYCRNMETVGTAYAESMKKQDPASYEAFVARVRG